MRPSYNSTTQQASHEIRKPLISSTGFNSREGDGSLRTQGAVKATNPSTEKAAIFMVPARPPSGDNEPRDPGGDFSTKTLLLLIIAGGVVELYMHDPRVGAAVVAAITVLVFLTRLIR